ncbi:hypothetical protein [Methylosinus sp. LW4]|uniref:hypothetical protein n=1 Tax=Methylosinus sp. LW4 TaxID=136993 RepID=UPI0003668E6B|nr:hypothetical protein [Methylosinus sp. LW4]
MSEPDTYHVAPLVGSMAGAGVSALLLNGPWPLRLVAGLAGGAFSFVGTPIFSPLVSAGVSWLYRQVGVDPALVPADAVPGLTGFVLGLTGIDFCRWLIERTKFGLSIMKIPWRKPDPS